MKKIIPTLLFICLATLSFFAQKPTQTPKPADDDDIVKISTSLIQVDVTVTDKSGKIISDLKPEDFEIYENGKKQEITNFSFISAGSRTEQVAVNPNDKTDAPVPPSKVRPEQVRRTIALVVDDLTLSFESTHFVRRALRNFVEKQMEDGDLVAIIRTGAGIGALQQFTTDKRQLYAAIEKVKWNPLGSGGIGAFAPIGSTLQTQSVDSDEENSDEEQIDAQADLNEFRESLFATGTLGAINFIVRGMKDLPGRKSVMLLSDGFSIFTQNSSGFRDSNRVIEPLLQLIDLANRSSVVIYTLDARGLVVTGITAADNVSELSTEQIQKAILERSDKLFNTQEGLNYLARQTGGIPFINNNDISGGIRKVLDDQSYYLIGYQPDEEIFDPAKRRFNKLEIKVKRNGANVRYRSGFFGITDEKVQRPTNLTPAQQITSALISPFGVSDISLNLNTVFRADAKYNSSISSFLHINTKNLKFSDEPNGDKKAVFDILAISFGDNGVPVDEISKTYTITLTEEIYKKILDKGFTYFFSFPVKKPGAYQMRVAIRDHGSEKLGSASQFIEVPKLKKKRLTISGIALENLTFEQWNNETKTNVKPETDPLNDTALRVFKRGTVLNYAYEIYNTKSDAGQKPQLQMKTRVFRDGKVIFENKPSQINLTGQTDMQVIKAAGSLALGTEMQTGDYVLQIIITDSLAKKKQQIATQFVQFEMID
jgi:VWFA-related protein